MTYEEIIQFHGHECPGLAIGYRMAIAAMENLESFRAEDEELVAIVENDACGVDAFSVLLAAPSVREIYCSVSNCIKSQLAFLVSRSDRSSTKTVWQGSTIRAKGKK